MWSVEIKSQTLVFDTLSLILDLKTIVTSHEWLPRSSFLKVSLVKVIKPKHTSETFLPEAKTQMVLLHLLHGVFMCI